MQFLALLLASASVVFADIPYPTSSPSSVQTAVPSDPNWCNLGWSGDGSCEKKGLNTYCCSFSQQGDFTIWRDVKEPSKSDKGRYDCLDYGLIYCA
ncbi:hypothetical protein E4U09_007986 [Claviceps aff. purpurea]|uniref:Uncharacterized protein n=1 Tax=Claviceps aff. purpurea TaxID=1967640 RepID=A0A9P7TYT0_9HYPO|nr:hypothetical protein E4U11_000543 [Claviceps purpurea]KAG6284320.1 hypothetical protein E4U09_007986 [Claviceps aff. purpurea]